MIGGRVLGNDENSSKNTLKKTGPSSTSGTPKKGYLKKRGYEPETSFEDSTTDSKGVDEKHHLDLTYSMAPGKKPRPDLEAMEHKGKDLGRKLSEQEKRTKAKLKIDPQLKRANKFRSGLIILGLIILLLGSVISYQNFSDISRQKDSLEKMGYDLLKELAVYENLKSDHTYAVHAWDVNKFLTLPSDELKEAFQTENKGIDFLIEVHDVSTFPVKYNRTIVNGFAWSSLETLPGAGSDIIPNDKFTIYTLLNIYVAPEEIHLVRVSVTVWR